MQIAAKRSLNGMDFYSDLCADATLFGNKNNNNIHRINLPLNTMSTNKLSKQMELEASQEENDLKSWNLHAKAHKEAKKEDFKEDVLPLIKASEKVSFVTDKYHFYQVGFKDGVIIDYYPVKNRLMQHKPVKWFYDGKNILLGML